MSVAGLRGHRLSKNETDSFTLLETLRCDMVEMLNCTESVSDKDGRMASGLSAEAYSCGNTWKYPIYGGVTRERPV